MQHDTHGDTPPPQPHSTSFHPPAPVISHVFLATPLPRHPPHTDATPVVRRVPVTRAAVQSSTKGLLRQAAAVAAAAAATPFEAAAVAVAVAVAATSPRSTATRCRARPTARSPAATTAARRSRCSSGGTTAGSAASSSATSAAGTRCPCRATHSLRGCATGASAGTSTTTERGWRAGFTRVRGDEGNRRSSVSSSVVLVGEGGREGREVGRRGACCARPFLLLSLVRSLCSSSSLFLPVLLPSHHTQHGTPQYGTIQYDTAQLVSLLFILRLCALFSKRSRTVLSLSPCCVSTPSL